MMTNSLSRNLFVYLSLAFGGSLHAAAPAEAAGNYTLFGEPKSTGESPSALYGNLSVSASGAFTIALKDFGNADSNSGQRSDYRLTGKLDAEGFGECVIYRNIIFGSSLYVQFQSGDQPSFSVWGNNYYIKGGEESYNFLGATAHKRVPSEARAGRYTALLSPNWGTNPPGADERAVEGQGWAVVSVNKKGVVATLGRLPNGRSFSYASSLRGDGSFWLYTGAGQLFKNQPNRPETYYYQTLDVVTGTVSLNTNETADGTGTLDWIRNNAGKDPGVRHPKKLDVAVSRYVAPPKDGSLTNHSAEFAEGPLTTSVSSSFSVANTANGPKARQLLLPFKTFSLPAGPGLNGSFAGIVKFPGLPAGTFSGVFLQRQEIAGGFFSTTPGPQSGILRSSDSGTSAQ